MTNADITTAQRRRNIMILIVTSFSLTSVLLDAHGATLFGIGVLMGGLAEFLLAQK